MVRLDREHTLYQHAKQADTYARKAFAKHKLIQETATQFLFKGPEHAHWFRVSLLPQRLVFTGDCGDLIFKTDPDPLDLFLCVSRTEHYWCSKLAHPYDQDFIHHLALKEARKTKNRAFVEAVLELDDTTDPLLEWQNLQAAHDEDLDDCVLPCLQTRVALRAIWKASYLYKRYMQAQRGQTKRGSMTAKH